MDTSLSKTEQEAIAGAVKAEIEKLIQGCESLDMELAFGMFHDSPDFIMIGTDGTQCSYETYVNNNVDYLGSCSAFKLTTFNEEIRVLDSQTAIYSWAYAAEATLKSGEKDIVDRAGASFVFRKMGDAWKVVYYHEATVPPRRVPADS